MASEYHIHGIELSPYSVKVRSYFRYKGIPHRWIPRSLDADGEYQKYQKLPLVPLVVTPDNKGIQDSTPIIEYVEAGHPEPSIHPADPAVKFVSALLEEFGDERLLEAARARHGSALELQRAIMQQVTAFCGGNFRDDATLLVLRIS